MFFTDTLTLDAPRKTKSGFMAVRARAARSGVYDYLGSEVDPTGEHFKAADTVKVYRDAADVFDKASVASFIAKPITNDHPTVAVTADNWDSYAKGTVMGALKDQEYLAFDLMLMDAATIAAVDAGKRELSNGYSCELVIGDGVAPDGTAYNAKQVNIRGNHVAVVDRGRAGSQCRISDSGGNSFAICDANPTAITDFNNEGPKMKIMLDGLHVDLSDAEAVKAAFDKKDAALADSDKALADSNAKVGTLTAEKAAVEKQLADANAVDLDALVADRASLVDAAKALDSKLVTDGKTSEEIRKEIVSASLGDVAKDFDASQISAAFAVIAKDAGKAADKVVNIEVPKVTLDSASVVNSIRAARYA
jgi:hypothetical protein